MEFIDQEAKANANLATNVDNLRSRYEEYADNNEFRVEFPSFAIESYDVNFFRLISSADKRDWNVNWSKRPDYASHDRYGTTIFWELILYVNSIDKVEDFEDLEYVLFPKYSSIVEVMRYKSLIGEIESLEEKPKVGANLYKTYPLDAKELAKREASQHLQKLDKYIPGYVADDLDVKMYDSNDDGEDDSWEGDPSEEVITDPDTGYPELIPWVSGDDGRPTNWAYGSGTHPGEEEENDPPEWVSGDGDEVDTGGLI